MESIFDLPAHPMFVHAPLVLMPLLALVGLALAVRPQWRWRFGVVSVGGAIVLVITTLLATQSGEAFDRALDRQGIPIDIETHQSLAETARLFAVLFAVLLSATVVVAGLQQRRSAATVGLSVSQATSAASARLPAPALAWAGHGCAALMVAVGVLGTVWMIRAGHEGANLVWNGTLNG